MPEDHAKSSDSAVSDQPLALAPVGAFRRWKTWVAKVGTHSSCRVLIKRDRKFCVGQRIEFLEEYFAKMYGHGVTPRWESGRIWKISNDVLFIER